MMNIKIHLFYKYDLKVNTYNPCFYSNIFICDIISSNFTSYV